MEWFDHYGNFLATVDFLIIGIPRAEDVFDVWEQNAFIFGFGLLDDLEELGGDLRCGRDALILRTSEDEEHVPAFFFFDLHNLLAVVTFGCCCLWWENTWIESVTAAIKDADDETIVEVS